eukprot:9491887-Pyramimonas_sp.AAC.1
MERRASEACSPETVKSDDDDDTLHQMMMRRMAPKLDEDEHMQIAAGRSMQDLKRGKIDDDDDRSLQEAVARSKVVKTKHDLDMEMAIERSKVDTVFEEGDPTAAPSETRVKRMHQHTEEKEEEEGEQ